MDAPKRATKKLTAIRIDPPDLEALAVIANDTGRSVASCIREAIKDWVRARGRKAARKAPAAPAAEPEKPATPRPAGYDPDLEF